MLKNNLKFNMNEFEKEEEDELEYYELFSRFCLGK
mgnify:CR=1 FL=1